MWMTCSSFMFKGARLLKRSGGEGASPHLPTLKIFYWQYAWKALKLSQCRKRVPKPIIHWSGRSIGDWSYNRHNPIVHVMLVNGFSYFNDQGRSSRRRGSSSSSWGGSGNPSSLPRPKWSTAAENHPIYHLYPLACNMKCITLIRARLLIVSMSRGISTLVGGENQLTCFSCGFWPTLRITEVIEICISIIGIKFDMLQGMAGFSITRRLVSWKHCEQRCSLTISAWVNTPGPAIERGHRIN